MEKDPSIRGGEPIAWWRRVISYVGDIRAERQRFQQQMADDAAFILHLLGDEPHSLTDTQVRERSGIEGHRVHKALDRLYEDGDIVMLVPGPDGLAMFHADEYPLRVTGFLDSDFVLGRLAEAGISPEDVLDFENGPRYHYLPAEK